jgi:ArsR family transcriptional regulator
MNVMNLSKIFKALSHPKRLELYLKIAEQNEADFDACRGCFVNDMIHFLKLGAPAISHHIKELENAGLIVTERKGKFLHATLRRDTLKQAELFFATLNTSA